VDSRLAGHGARLVGNLLAIVVTLALMVVVAWVIERLALRHLVNQEPITC
jgi:branched-chain amino acid transport system permease protein